MLTHFKNHIWYILASVLLSIGLVWLTISSFGAKTEFDATLLEKQNQLTELETNHKIILDSLQKTRVEQISTIFSWSVRGELMRENLEQVDQLFRKFIKESSVRRVELIEATTKKIVMSSDRKTENEEIPSDDPLWNLSEVEVRDNGDEILVLVPLMDMTRKLGVLRIAYTKNSLTQTATEEVTVTVE
jgi:hypothetical protein